MSQDVCELIIRMQVIFFYDLHSLWETELPVNYADQIYIMLCCGAASGLQNLKKFLTAMKASLKAVKIENISATKSVLNSHV